MGKGVVRGGCSQKELPGEGQLMPASSCCSRESAGAGGQEGTLELREGREADEEIAETDTLQNRMDRGP